MAEFYKAAGVEKDSFNIEFMNAQPNLYYAPTIVYLTLPKGHIKYSVLDLGGLEMSLMLAAKDHGVDSIPAYETYFISRCFKEICKNS